MSKHIWVASNLGHGNLMCCLCYTTDLEAQAMGELSSCRIVPQVPVIPWRGTSERRARLVEREPKP